MAETSIKNLTVTSAAFKHEGKIPLRYTCDGEGINPPISIEEIPANTKTLALIVEDPDAPKGIYDHWVVWNIHPVSDIRQNSNPGISGNNSSGKTGYHPPCPPKGSHRYFFHVYALDTEIDLVPGATKEKLQQTIKPHILAKGTLMGTYQRV